MTEITEQAGEAVEEAIDGVVEVVEVVRNNPSLLIGGVFIGAGLGVALGYIWGTKKTKAMYEELMEREIEEAKQFYSSLHKVDEDGAVLSPMDVLTKLHGAEEAAMAVRTYQGDDPEGYPEGEPYDDVRDEEHLAKMQAELAAKREAKVVVAEEDGTIMTSEVQQTTNIFSDPTFDLEEERKYRTPDRPYIITHDEYFEAEKDYDTQSLTYYETDEVVCDEQDKPMEDVDDIIGDEHLARFGHGSKDNNIVYIRNEKLETDYEVIRSKGSYLEEVLGMLKEEPNSLKHSDQRDRRREFRYGDG